MPRRRSSRSNAAAPISRPIGADGEGRDARLAQHRQKEDKEMKQLRLAVNARLAECVRQVQEKHKEKQKLELEQKTQFQETIEAIHARLWENAPKARAERYATASNGPPTRVPTQSEAVLPQVPLTTGDIDPALPPSEAWIAPSETWITPSETSRVLSKPASWSAMSIWGPVSEASTMPVWATPQQCAPDYSTSSPPRVSPLPKHSPCDSLCESADPVTAPNSRHSQRSPRVIHTEFVDIVNLRADEVGRGLRQRKEVPCRVQGTGQRKEVPCRALLPTQLACTLYPVPGELLPSQLLD